MDLSFSLCALRDFYCFRRVSQRAAIAIRECKRVLYRVGLQWSSVSRDDLGEKKGPE